MLAHIGLEIVDQRPAQVSSNRQALLGALAVDGALDLEQRVDAAHDLDCDRRQRDFLFARGLAPGVLLEIGHGEERAPRMDPTRRLPDRARLSARQIELVVAVIGVGLQDAGISRQMRLRMLAPAIARVVEHRRGRPDAAERLVVANINPAPPGIGFALGQNRHGRIVAMQALGRHDMGFDKAKERIERRADRAHRVGHGRQRDRHAFQRIALGLTVQRLMLAELLEHDHRQQARPRPAPRDRHGTAPAPG